MTEAGPVLSMCLAFAKEPFEVKSGSCGTVVRNAELKIIDPETGFSLSRNQPGEICIRGNQIMKGTFGFYISFLIIYLEINAKIFLIHFKKKKKNFLNLQYLKLCRLIWRPKQ